MSTIVVSHAYGADEQSVWFPYLRNRLEPLGHRVEIPKLPDTHAPRLGPWRATFAKRAAATPPADTVLVGHSIGAVNVLRFLEQHAADCPEPFAGTVLVAPPAHEVGYDALTEFFADPFDWSRIRRTASRFRILAAADDPVLIPDPFEHVAALVKSLGATALVAPTGGHFGATPDDHIELPQLVSLILDTLDAREVDSALANG